MNTAAASGEGPLPEFKYLTYQLSDAEAWRKSVSNTAEQVLIKAEIIRKQLQERARTVASSRAAGGATAAATPVAATTASAGADADAAAGAVADAVAATAAPTPPPLATPPVPPPATAVEAAATTGAVEVAQAQALLARSTTALTPPASLDKSEARQPAPNSGLGDSISSPPGMDRKHKPGPEFEWLTREFERSRTKSPEQISEPTVESLGAEVRSQTRQTTAVGRHHVRNEQAHTECGPAPLILFFKPSIVKKVEDRSGANNTRRRKGKRSISPRCLEGDTCKIGCTAGEEGRLTTLVDRTDRAHSMR